MKHDSQEDVSVCEECGASVYKQHLESGIARYEGGRLFCSHCVAEYERTHDAAASGITEDLAPIELDEEEDIDASAGTSAMSSTRIHSLSEATLVSLETITVGDTTMELSDAGCDRIGCDDDGGAGLASALSSCLPAGEYHVRIRPFTELQFFNYNLETDGEAGCIPDDPPTTTADGLFMCSTPDQFDNCIPDRPNGPSLASFQTRGPRKIG